MVSASSPEDEESPEEEPSFPGLDKWCIVARESWERRSVGWRSVRGQEGGGTRRITGGRLGRAGKGSTNE